MRTSPSPFISVIIPTFQRNDLLEKCLKCLAPGKQTGMTLSSTYELSPNLIASSCLQITESEERSEPGHSVLNPANHDPVSLFTYEVIVADDGRRTTAELMIKIQFPWVQWVQGPRIGPAGNRNAGASVASGTWLVFTDDDCLPQAGWLFAFCQGILGRPACAVFEGDICAERPRKTLAEHAPVGGGAGNLWSCNFAIHRNLFAELGGFDTRFRVCMEDSDFALRVRKSGSSFPFLPDAKVVHPWRERHLFSDGWKNHDLEITDHLSYNKKHSLDHRKSAMNLMRLAINSLRSDCLFVVRHRDINGLPFALLGFLKYCQLAWRYYIA